MAMWDGRFKKELDSKTNDEIFKNLKFDSKIIYNKTGMYIDFILSTKMYRFMYRFSILPTKSPDWLPGTI